MILIAYVDDLIVVGKVNDVEEPRKHTKNSFPTKNLGKLVHNSGCSLSRDSKRGVLKHSQTVTIDKSLDRFCITPLSALHACSSPPLRARVPIKEEILKRGAEKW